ncbi:hypothetical protein PHLCEN_2v9882 [Hermanssonia centrifuga]|uniref:Uncharacterized protein n=1 Tax=Hermanssonia centrifuga TaxID=98765 RepID=A0A2R6NQA4_9APHY|nr:hypothetical protein PHLCEN_2v9882 [Hermanssonia centrifuga]
MLDPTVLEEACSSRYKSVLHSKTFDSAVKKFRQQENEKTNRIHAQTKPQVARKHSASSITNATVAAKEDAQRELECLPNEIIREARTFHEHMQYFVNNGGNVEETMTMESQGQGSSGVASRIPNELRELLDQISEYEGIGERAKREILEDSDSRNVSRFNLEFILPHE